MALEIIDIHNENKMISTQTFDIHTVRKQIYGFYEFSEHERKKEKTISVWYFFRWRVQVYLSSN